ncbi:MAG: dephospho-CoA kinase [Deltaproteobacteria bacterium]|jgi:dephospho-CoA kinase|nr:dephospho-CoA kinase [Deltaproteobacteria bacterium]
MSAERPKLEKRAPDPPPPPWATDPEGLLRSRPGAVKAALTGGIATGKSLASEIFAVFGAERIDFDDLCRRAVAKGSPGLDEVASLFGPKVIAPDGQMDRAKVAKIVFKDKVAREALEAVIHPAAWSLMLGDLKALPPSPLVVIEVPLLFEANLAPLFNPVIFCFAKIETQLARLKSRDKMGRWAAKRRLKAQMPMAEKLRRADMIIDNDGPVAKTLWQVKDLWRRLTSPDFALFRDFAL